jgi:uncharacterized protein YbaP (TraB family)
LSNTTRLPTLLRTLASLAASLLLWGSARADDGLHVMWQVAGKHNTVYLLGSVHVLNANNHALPAVADAAYADASVLVEELDLFAAVGDVLGADVLAEQTLPQGQMLPAVLGPELNAKLKAAAGPLGIDPDLISRMQPWYVATMISTTRLLRAGYSPQDGVDFQIAQRAHHDGKPIVGLETAAQQLGFLASMSMDDQRKFLSATLEETDTPQELQQITDAWRNGDLTVLESLLKQGMDEAPELFQKIVVQRNRNWLPRIEQMLADPDKDYLVVTGALHMIGPQGLIQMLRARGYQITRK